MYFTTCFGHLGPSSGSTLCAKCFGGNYQYSFISRILQIKSSSTHVSSTVPHFTSLKLHHSKISDVNIHALFKKTSRHVTCLQPKYCIAANVLCRNNFFIQCILKIRSLWTHDSTLQNHYDSDIIHHNRPSDIVYPEIGEDRTPNSCEYLFL